MIIAGGLLACAGVLPRSHDYNRVIPQEPTPLALADTGPPLKTGGGGYDGTDTIVFDVSSGQKTKLYFSQYARGGWTKPIPALPGFDAWHAGGQVSPGGNALFFESSQREPAVAGREDSDIWVAERVGNAWGRAHPIGAPFDSPHNEHNVTISRGATICINSNRAGLTRHHDILCAMRAGSAWEDPRPLGPAVNSASADIAPFIDPEERFLLFASNRPGGAGAFDLYISHRQGGEWQPAAPLDAAVNSAASESNPAVSLDGQRLLFTRSAAERVVLHEVKFNPRWLNSVP